MFVFRARKKALSSENHVGQPEVSLDESSQNSEAEVSIKIRKTSKDYVRSYRAKQIILVKQKTRRATCPKSVKLK